MPLGRLDHAVLSVRDLDRSLAFHRDLLGSRVSTARPGRCASAPPLDDAALEARSRIRRLGLAREQARYGPHPQGGIGISR